MRFVFVGAGQLALMTARLLIGRGHEVVVVEIDRTVIDTCSEDLDCAFIHGDGSKPHILREAGPNLTDVLFALTDDDRVNMLAALIGRSLGFRRVVPRIVDPELTSICVELGLEHTIVPDMTISRYLADSAIGVDIIEISTMVKGEARFLSFVLHDGDPSSVGELALPELARVVCVYRNSEFLFVDDESELRPGDEVMVLTHSRHLTELRKRWQAKRR